MVVTETARNIIWVELFCTIIKKSLSDEKKDIFYCLEKNAISPEKYGILQIHEIFLESILNLEKLPFLRLLFVFYW